MMKRSGGLVQERLGHCGMGFVYITKDSRLVCLYLG